MILSTFLRVFCLAGFFCLTALGEEKFDLAERARSLVEAEKAYAKMGWEKGFRAASLGNFADDAVIFAPQLVNGKKFWTEAKEDPVIKWGPSLASIARSGELGFTTGPAEYFESRGDAKPVGFGHFVSIWRRGSDGVWKVMVDVGVNHTEPSEALGDVKTWVPKMALAHPESAKADFEKARSAFVKSLGEDEGAAILAAASDVIRIYRRGAVPLAGKEPAKSMLAAEHAKTIRTSRGGGLSEANDLAFDYGDYSSVRNGAAEQGIYFCIWRLVSDGEWVLVVDLQKKAPAPQK